jgi:hypothetical protein
MVAITAGFIGIWRSFRITVFDTYHGVFVMRKAFDWKRSSISLLDVDAVRDQSFIRNFETVQKPHRMPPKSVKIYLVNQAQDHISEQN